MLKHRPAVAAALLWTAGYALACWTQWSWLSLYTSLFLALAAAAVWLLRAPGRSVVCGILLIGIAAGYYANYDRGNQTALPIATRMSEQQEAIDYETAGLIVSTVDVDGDKAAFTIRSDREGEGGEAIAVTVRLLTKEEQEQARTWRRGDAVSLSGLIQRPGEARNFDGFDYRAYLRLKHIHWQLNVKGVEQIQVGGSRSWNWYTVLRWNDQFRETLGGGIERIFPADQAGFMKSMLVGVRSDMDPLQFQQFSQLGLSHILAVSGLHVGIFLACLLWLMRRLGFTREAYLLTAMAMMPIYIVVTGAAPSIVRAGLMAMIALYAAYRHALKDGLNTVLIVGFGMLVWDPYYIHDVSFQLSFLVTIGLIIGVPAVNRLLPIRSAAWKNAVSIALVAQLVSFPVSIYYFNQFSLLSLAANFFLVPVFSLVSMPGGTASLILGLIYAPVGKAAAWLIARVNDLVFAVVDVSSRWDVFQTIWPSPGIGWIASYYASLTAVGWLLLAIKDRRTENDRPMLTPAARSNPISGLASGAAGRTAPAVGLTLSILSLLVLLGFAYKPDLLRDFGGEVDFIDVGQGDSILITTPLSRSVILIDGGGTVSFRKPGDEWKQRKDPYEVGRKLLVPLLKKRGIQRIDYLIVTHQDTDHIGGLQAVIEQIPVGRLLFNGTFKPGPGAEKLFQTALDKQVRLVKAHAGDTLQPDGATLLHILAPAPPEDHAGLRLEKNQNGESVVIYMEMSGTRWLFTGDMDQASENDVLTRLEAVNAAGGTTTTLPTIDVLKVAHHGSKTSTGVLWLDAWKPRMAVISAGVHNSYGHPNPLVLGRLEERNVSILRTDKHGEVQMKVKGGNIRLRTKLTDSTGR
ncbi:ComEC/Rec2 family competence protein [Paenibacillus piri]|uniref:ComEC family DNA internalization-related competence protein n=1 Tax=Paenibacillus piri TaxID=2547395 RepID=A0A4R5KMD6_9BACL|nr:ComEC/Rec2 family competence protein [Paenibacillus piri]TDF96773.1 ComEC family DNA internalization-related competence protein [Paenibacillus piri]